MPGMLGIRQRAKWRRALYSKATAFVLFMLAIFVLYNAYEMYGKYTEAKGKRDEALRELNELQAREAELTAKIDTLKTDRGVESAIRDRFMVAKEGEDVIIITEPDKEEYP